MRFKDFVAQKDLVELQSAVQMKSLKDEINILFENRVWDGVLAGICECQFHFFYPDSDKTTPFKRKCYFTCFDERILDYDDDTRPIGWWRRFALIWLSDEEIKQEIERHEDFRRIVGNHCDYENNQRLPRSKCISYPHEQALKFFDKYPVDETNKKSYADHEVCGWFEINYDQWR